MHENQLKLILTFAFHALLFIYRKSWSSRAEGLLLQRNLKTHLYFYGYMPVHVVRFLRRNVGRRGVQKPWRPTDKEPNCLQTSHTFQPTHSRLLSLCKHSPTIKELALMLIELANRWRQLIKVGDAEQTCAPKVQTSANRDCHKTICMAVQPTMSLISFVPYSIQGRRIQLSYHKSTF